MPLTKNAGHTITINPGKGYYTSVGGGVILRGGNSLSGWGNSGYGKPLDLEESEQRLRKAKKQNYEVGLNTQKIIIPSVIIIWLMFFIATIVFVNPISLFLFGLVTPFLVWAAKVKERYTRLLDEINTEILLHE